MTLTKSDWERISAESHGFLLRIARARIEERLRSKLGPESVVQEALAEAFEHRSDFRGTTAEELRAYLRKTLEHNITDGLRRFRRAKRNLALEVPLQGGGTSRPGERALSSRLGPERVAGEREAERRFMAALDTLPDAERDVVRLAHFSNLSLRAIAVELDWSYEAVRRLKAQGEKRLRAQLEAAQGDE